MARDKDGKGLTKKNAVKGGAERVKADDMVAFESTGGTHLKKGTKRMHRLVAEKLEAKGVGSIVVAMMLMLLMAFAPLMEVKAQAGAIKNLYSSYGVASLADTVTNAGTAYLITPTINGQYRSVTVQASGTEISGTTGGSVVLQGSLDGTNFVTLTSSTHVPNIAAKTPTDVTTVQTWEWQIQYSPFIKYRVLWTGTGTMVARLHSAKILYH